ncbi:unnamed protein product [Closterium sp. Yama58-4]|nr:unnamed protein product [Closterium sp. Yama58-4]
MRLPYYLHSGPVVVAVGYGFGYYQPEWQPELRAVQAHRFHRRDIKDQGTPLLSPLLSPRPFPPLPLPTSRAQVPPMPRALSPCLTRSPRASPTHFYSPLVRSPIPHPVSSHSSLILSTS